MPVRRLARHARQVADALTSVCQGTFVDLSGDHGLRIEFVRAARHHRIAPLAQSRIRNMHPDVAAKLADDRNQAKTMFLQSVLLLKNMAEVFADIPWLGFKGPFLSQVAHPVPGIRTFGDVDLLVSPRRLREAVGRLQAAGWDIVDRADMLLNTETPGEMHLVSPTGLVVDLHWSMINMAATRQHFPQMTELLLRSRQQATVGQTSAWTLSPADSLVHVCLHGALAGADRLLFLLDADQLARQTDDWDAVFRRARTWGAGPAMYVVLRRAHDVLGTQLPPDLDRSLGVSGTVRLLAATADWLSPVPSLRKDASLARLVARAVRPTGRQMATEVVRRGRTAATQRAWRRSEPRRWSQRPQADAAALEAYLSTVEKHG